MSHINHRLYDTNVGIAIINHPDNHHKWVVQTIKNGWIILAIPTLRGILDKSIQSGGWEGLAPQMAPLYCAAKPEPHAPGKVAQKLRRAHSQHSQTWLRMGTMGCQTGVCIDMYIDVHTRPPNRL